MEYSSGQIRRLRAEGHRLGLKPVVTVGQKGLSDNLHAELEAALDHHELLKLRIPAGDRAARREFAERICARHQAVLVESIGSVIVIYRPNPDCDRFGSLLAESR